MKREKEGRESRATQIYLASSLHCNGEQPLSLTTDLINTKGLYESYKNAIISIEALHGYFS